MIWTVTRTLDLLGRPVLRSEVEAETPARRPMRKYDPAWLDGQQRTIWRGQDFERDPEHFRIYLHDIARSHGLHCRTSVCGDSIQFRYTKESP